MARRTGTLRGMTATAVVTLCAIGCWAAEPTSQTDPHLKKYLEKFPAADANGDGILTASEAWEYQGKTAARQSQQARQAPGKSLPKPDEENVSYGPYERDVLDLWRAKSDKPTPLAVYIHGGGFMAGDKRTIAPQTLQLLRKAGISVAAINYRFTTTHPFPASQQDGARAIQFLRYHAPQWNLDPARVAAFGGSAGGGISLWLGFHDDMADPKSDDPVARQSTRLCCVGSLAGQCSYDPHVIKQWVGGHADKHSFFLPAYGVKTFEELDDPKLQKIYDETAAIKHLTADDAPVFMVFSEPNAPLPPDAKAGQGMHHPVFGLKLKEAMDKLKIENVYLHTAEFQGNPQLEMVKFFCKHFGIAPPAEEPASSRPPQAGPQAAAAGGLSRLAAAAPQGPAGKQRAAEPGKKRTWSRGEWLDPDHDAPNGTHYQTFPSKLLGREVSYLIYLPPGYEQQNTRYPVIYWLHGLGGNQRAGAQMFVPHVDAAIKQGVLPPAIVVVVNGMVSGFYCDSVDGQRPVESVIVQDLIPHVDRTYRTIAQREGRVIQGYSMGGYGAAHLGFKYPELFGAVAVDAGALITMGGPPESRGSFYKDVWSDSQERFQADHPLELVRKNADKLRNHTHIHLGVGTEDNLLPNNQQLHELLQELHIEHQYELVSGVAHNSKQYYDKLGTKGFDFHRKVFESLTKSR